MPHAMLKCWEYLGIQKEQYSWPTGIIPSNPSRILDIGCSDGLEAIALQWVFQPKELIVVDKEGDREEKLNGLVQETKQYLPLCWNNAWSIKFKLWDIRNEQEGLDLGKFDLVYGDNVLYYIFHEDRRMFLKALSNIFNATRPGGFVAFVEPKVGKRPAVKKDENTAINEKDWLNGLIGSYTHLDGQSYDFRPDLVSAGFKIVHYSKDYSRYLAVTPT